MSMEQLVALSTQMKTLQASKAELEETLKGINKELNDIRTRKIPELMESMELRNCTIEGIGRVQLAADIFAFTKAGQKEQAMQWLRDCGYDDMISETYNASSLKALLRRMMTDGADIPEELFSVTPFMRASIVKA